MTNPTFGTSHSMIAAAKKVQLGRMQRVGQPWQENLWTIYETLGPVHYGMNFKRNAAMRINYYAAEHREGEDEPVETTNQAAIEAVERLGNLAQIVGDFTIQTNVAGEGYLYGGDDEPFEVLSTVEVQARQSGENKIDSKTNLLLTRTG